MDNAIDSEIDNLFKRAPAVEKYMIGYRMAFANVGMHPHDLYLARRLEAALRADPHFREGQEHGKNAAQ